MIHQAINGIKLGIFSNIRYSSAASEALSLSFLNNMVAISLTITPLNLALQAARLSPLSLATRSFLYLTPLTLSYLELSVQNERLKRWVYNANRCFISPACKAVVVASSVGLIVCGSPIAGSICLTYTIIQIANSKKWIRPVIPAKMGTFGFTAIGISYLVSSSLLDKVKLIALLGYLSLFRFRSRINEKAAEHRNNRVIPSYSITDVNEINTEITDFAINLSYIDSLENLDSSSFPALFSFLLKRHEKSFEFFIKQGSPPMWLVSLIERIYVLKPPFFSKESDSYINFLETTPYRFYLLIIENSKGSGLFQPSVLLEDLLNHAEKEPSFLEALRINLGADYKEKAKCSMEEAIQWVLDNCFEEGKIKQSYLQFILLKHGVIKDKKCKIIEM